MLNKYINVLKITDMLIDMNYTGRTSLLDLKVLLVINENPGLGKMQIMAIIDPDRFNKSFLDKPVLRLIEYDLIEEKFILNPAKVKGEAEVIYYISKFGRKKLKKCSK